MPIPMNCLNPIIRCTILLTALASYACNEAKAPPEKVSDGSPPEKVSDKAPPEKGPDAPSPAKDSDKGAPVKVLDAAAESAKTLTVRHSMIGFRNTLIFYTFEDQNAALRLDFDNKSRKFPFTATVYLFADRVTGDGLKKWLNNQHSDGLYADAPEPVATHKIPEKLCTTKSQKLIEKTEETHGKYENYSVKFSIGEFTKKKAFKLKGFTAETAVYAKTK